ncbi:hypothetical protein K438DRAFT_217233 [Mycena galopus ATCC 62051]|nr:hypothetical protein K438DRAFT_217233 [Mycena galopus ATCC 62051]
MAWTEWELGWFGAEDRALAAISKILAPSQSSLDWYPASSHLSCRSSFLPRQPSTKTEQLKTKQKSFGALQTIQTAMTIHDTKTRRVQTTGASVLRIPHYHNAAKHFLLLWKQYLSRGS